MYKHTDAQKPKIKNNFSKTHGLEDTEYLEHENLYSSCYTLPWGKYAEIVLISKYSYRQKLMSRGYEQHLRLFFQKYNMRLELVWKHFVYIYSCILYENSLKLSVFRHNEVLLFFCR